MSSVWAVPAAEAKESERAKFLQKVGALTLAGLTASGATAIGSAVVLASTPILWNRLAMLAIIMGTWALSNFVFRPMVFQSEAIPAKIAAFFAGAVSQGVALGYMLLIAVAVAVSDGSNPLLIIGQAMAITGLVAVGLFGWLLTGPKDLSMVRGAMTIAALPMLALMAITFVFPITGIAGIVVSAVFVAISTAGLLIQLDRVVHTLPTTRWVEGSYQITLGLLVLFWNLLSLLSRRR